MGIRPHGLNCFPPLVSNGVDIFGPVLAMGGLFAALCLIAIDFFHPERLGGRPFGVPLSPPAAGSPVEPESGNEPPALIK